MNFLAINTANINSEICVQINEKVKRELLNDSHSEHLLPKIDYILKNNNIEIKDVDFFGVNVGPGSFTGIRIGVATIKAFIVAYNKPCVVFNSFDICAYNIKDANFIVLVNSGNKDYYFAIYKNNVFQSMNCAEIKYIIELAKNENLKIYASDNEKLNLHDIENEISFVNCDNCLQGIMEERISKNQFCEIQNIIPLYIKRSQAEVGLNDKINRELIIEKCTDINDLTKIENECFEDAWSEEIFKQELLLKDRYYYIAKVNDKSVGYVGLWQTGDDLNLLKIAVIPTFRKLGIALKLLDKCKQIKDENNLENFFLEVDCKNEKAIKLYEKFGFKTEYTRKKYYKNGNDCLVMFYNLKNKG